MYTHNYVFTSFHESCGKIASIVVYHLTFALFTIHRKKKNPNKSQSCRFFPVSPKSSTVVVEFSHNHHNAKVISTTAGKI